jgi:glycosyltransferase involved in cell wall biosynthesis
MKILFVSTEFEEQARGITGIIRSMVAAAKADGHEVGVLVGLPSTSTSTHELLDKKVSHLYLQHYLATGKKHIFPEMRSRKNQLKIIGGREFAKVKEIKIDHDVVVDKKNMINDLDFVVQIPYVYHFINHGLGKLVKPYIKKSVKKYDVDLVITGAPMDLSKSDVAPAKLAQFVHDTMPINMLETPADNNTPIKFARQFYAAAAKSDMALVNSQDTASKIHEVNPAANVSVLYGTASNKASQFTDDSYLLRKGLKKDNFLLFISAIEKRKNIDTLMDAYAKVSGTLNMPLIIVGGKGFGYKDIMAHYQDLPGDVRDRIIFTGFVTETEKYCLLNNARAFVFPSLYEGIGLPIIEAYNSGLPVLTSERGALSEAGGKAALYVKNPYDTQEIADGIMRIATDDKLRAELVKHIPEQISQFTPDKFKERFSSALKEL